ncbi:ANTAR domain-containing protein [Kordiimonas pumila]|uniref:Response regulatory domain-containing protein n=1 Tax=Kordiimonas pumila TaxID=2161677 RepID=A0ABV7D088_9PROT|nr:hypothetical protein [Kordiimonas pumila]
MAEFNYKALIAVSDTRVADTINFILGSHNIMDVVRVDCTHDAIDAMLDIRFDLFFVDARVPVTFQRNAVLYGGIDYIRFIRMCEGRVSEATIVFMRQQSSMQNLLETRDEILSARDAGASCVLTHPLTIEKFDEEVLPILAKPKPFVRARSYTGPDRREKQFQVSRDRRIYPSSTLDD